MAPPAMGVTVENFGAPADPADKVLRGQRAAFVPVLADYQQRYC